MDIKKILTEGVVFKKGKDELGAVTKTFRKKPKGKTISGAAKMKAACRAKKKNK